MDEPVFRWMPADKYAELVMKAESQGIVLTPIPRFRKLMRASSASNPGDGYLVDEFACSCPAARTGHWCKHLALYHREHFGRLVLQHGFPDWIDIDMVATTINEAVAAVRD